MYIRNVLLSSAPFFFKSQIFKKGKDIGGFLHRLHFAVSDLHKYMNCQIYDPCVEIKGMSGNEQEDPDAQF